MPIFDLLFRKYREKTILVILILASLTLLLLPRPAKVDMAQSVLGTLFTPVGRLTRFGEDLLTMRSENRHLKRMVATLMNERERLLQYRAEHERLRRLAEFKEEQSFKLVPCEVVGRNLDRFQTILVLDKGKADSIAVRMPVLSYQGYVGRVIKVFDNSAWVELIASRNNPVSCIDKRSRVVGVLEWKSHSLFELKDVSIVEDVQIGDTLITSGFGGIVPKGFLVAVVARVAHDIDGLSLNIDARSHIDFRSMEEVFVVTDKIPWDRSIFYDSADSAAYRDAIGGRP
jgi:rod shape-determining protein MreC